MTVRLGGAMVLLLAGLLFASCAKEEGFGGNSHIKGTIIEKVYNDDFSLLLYEQPAADEDVFIVFGKDDFAGEDVKTDYNGQFKFSYLHPGDYQIFYYSDDSLSAYQENTAFVHQINLGKKETIDMGELTIVNSIAFDQGNATIKGRVYLINYKNSSVYPNLEVKDTTFAQEENIYVRYGNHPFYDDKIDTQHDGTFFFQYLIKGKYEIYLYSEDVSGGTQDIIITRNVEITQESEIIDLGNIYIEQL